MCKSFSCTNTVDYLSPVWVRLRKYRSNQVCWSVINADLVVAVVVVHETTIGKLGGETGRIKGDADKGSRVFGLRQCWRIPVVGCHGWCPRDASRGTPRVITDINVVFHLPKVSQWWDMC